MFVSYGDMKAQIGNGSAEAVAKNNKSTEMITGDKYTVLAEAGSRPGAEIGAWWLDMMDGEFSDDDELQVTCPKHVQRDGVKVYCVKM